EFAEEVEFPAAVIEDMNFEDTAAGAVAGGDNRLTGQRDDRTIDQRLAIRGDGIAVAVDDRLACDRAVNMEVQRRVAAREQRRQRVRRIAGEGTGDVILEGAGSPL